MGDLPPDITTERLLIVFFKELPVPFIEHVRRKFPDAELTVHQSQKGVLIPRGWLIITIILYISVLTNKNYGTMQR